VNWKYDKIVILSHFAELTVRMVFMEEILEVLNDEQRRAVESSANFLQISAGPGTGKTSTLAARIFHKQFEYDMNPNELIAISFSRSAKQQLIKKMQEYTNELGYGSVIEILTFHSLAHRIIRYGIHCGESTFRQGFDTIETEFFVNRKPDILIDLCSEYKDRDLVATALSKGLNLLRQGKHLDHQIYHHWSEMESNNTYKVNIDASDRVIVKSDDLKKYWQRIEKLQKIQNITDYQGLINEAISLLVKDGQTYKLIANDLKHIFVDEYQDTSLSQEGLLFSLAKGEKDITVVGDEKQTIYSFNGSNAENLNRFYLKSSNIEGKTTEHIQLTTNYRSTKPIIQLSNHFIKQNVIEPSDSKENELAKNPLVINTQSLELASSFIASEVMRLRHTENVSYDDICILYRKDSEHAPQARTLINELENYDIPIKQSMVIEKKKVNLKEEIITLNDEYSDLQLDEIISSSKSEELSEEAVTFIKSAIAEGTDSTEDLIDLLFEIDEVQEESSAGGVSLRTVHSAKGQEYPIVFILYLADRHFPHGSQPDISEEERLLYVGITRAEKQLYIIGQHGVRFEDFLGRCKSASSEYVNYHSRFEYENVDGYELDSEDVNVIKETSKKQLEEEKKEQDRLIDLMDDW